MTNFTGERDWIHAHEYETRLIIGIVVVLALLGAFGWQRVKYEKLQEQYHALALRAVNDSARADTTRALALSRADSLRILGDSLRAVTRLTVQVAPQQDALDRALGQLRVATQQLDAKIAALNVRAAGAVHTDSAGTRSATFAVDTTPYHGTAAVALPAIGPGSLDLRLRLDPAPLTVRSSCSAPNAQGIRSASVVVLGPTWLDVAVRSSEQTPEICNAQKPAGRRWFGWPDLVFGAGYTANAHGAGWGAFVGVGGHLGP